MCNLARRFLVLVMVFYSFSHLPVSAQSARKGLLWDSADLARWRARAKNGPYLKPGDAGENTPGDWQRIRQFAFAFTRNPFEAGNSSAENLNLWTGYDRAIDSLDQYPVWQGIKLECAAFVYLVEGDTQCGRLAHDALLRQARMPAAGHVGLNIGAWPEPANSQKRPTFESGTKECVWLTRLAYAYDYLLPLFTKAERAEMRAFFAPPARYFARRAAKRFAGLFPDRMAGSYAKRLYLAAQGGVPQFKPSDPIYQPADQPRAKWAGDGLTYTHRNADRSLGNKISRLATYYNNRVAERMTYILAAGLLCDDTELVAQAVTYQKEWLMFSVYPDGTYGEYERDGDYGNPSQGAMWYGSLCLQSYLTSAAMLARRGDSTLWKFSTREGAHGTQIAAGRPLKSIRTVLMRYVNNCTSTDPIYYAEVTPDNRIDLDNENKQAKFPTAHATWDYILAFADRLSGKPAYKAVYQRKTNGTVPYAGSGYTTAAKVWLPWCGTGAEWPGFLFMYGE